MSESTPGPWEITVHEDRFEISMGSALDTSRAGYEPQHKVTLAWDTDYDEDEDEAVIDQVEEAYANAYLIAAAPLLLEALKLHVGKNGHTAGCTQVTAKAYPCSRRCRLTREALAATTPAASEAAGQ